MAAPAAGPSAPERTPDGESVVAAQAAHLPPGEGRDRDGGAGQHRRHHRIFRPREGAAGTGGSGGGYGP
ncbi:hypothetical protein GCM10010302_29760 [Streptomyces polychromogenes]|uniref:Uncharacterized protein n=1 Tax=Streptomyces polychromogenes TaxID=67342 RepID=A0ABP3F397_9ACTN